MALPKFLHKYLWSYDVSSVSPQKDKELIITHVLNLGNTKALRWLFRTYSLEQIKTALEKPWRGVWEERSLNYWKNILGVKIPKELHKKAIFRLEPQIQK